jgi:LuxR family maltose regulon positive regulatory protein
MSGSDYDAGEFTLLSTKLNRPWLLDRLRCGQGHQPMMTSALAGSGQSTLLCQTLDSCPLYPTAWLWLDAGDNGLAAFVSRLIGTIQTVFPTPQTRRSAPSQHLIRRWR